MEDKKKADKATTCEETAAEQPTRRAYSPPAIEHEDELESLNLGCTKLPS